MRANTLSFEKVAESDTILDEAGQSRYRQLLGRLLWLDRLDIKNTVCQLPTHVGTATTRDERNIKRLLRYLVGNLACNMIVGCNLDVLGIAGTPQGSVLVMLMLIGLEMSRIVAVNSGIEWSKVCNCSSGTIVLCTDSAAALGFVERKGASRRTRHVDTKVSFTQAWAVEPGQRILKVHGDSQRVADCLTKIMTSQAAHRRALGL